MDAYYVTEEQNELLTLCCKLWPRRVRSSDTYLVTSHRGDELFSHLEKTDQVSTLDLEHADPG